MTPDDSPAQDHMSGSLTKTATIDKALNIAQADIDWYDSIALSTRL